MQSLVKACEQGLLPARVVLVVSNKSQAAGIEWAREHGLSCEVLCHRDYDNRESHDRAVIERLQAAGVEWVCLAGYMRLLSPVFVAAFANRILNIHPSLLPAFPGLHAQEQAWKHGARVSGCTVHLVDTELDHGPIVLQRAVPVEEDDTADTLADRILVQEHQLYPEALKQLITRPWRLEDRRIVWQT
jgi:phosphoribosylglycinamide formyltransferase-1